VSEQDFEATRKSGTGCDVWMAGMRFYNKSKKHFLSEKVKKKKNRVKLRPDWEAVKVRVMYDGNRAKVILYFIFIFIFISLKLLINQV
jgi:hypothetical protein